MRPPVLVFTSLLLLAVTAPASAQSPASNTSRRANRKQRKTEPPRGPVNRGPGGRIVMDDVPAFHSAESPPSDKIKTKAAAARRRFGDSFSRSNGYAFLAGLTMLVGTTMASSLPAFSYPTFLNVAPPVVSGFAAAFSMRDGMRAGGWRYSPWAAATVAGLVGELIGATDSSLLQSFASSGPAHLALAATPVILALSVKGIAMLSYDLGKRFALKLGSSG